MIFDATKRVVLLTLSLLFLAVLSREVFFSPWLEWNAARIAPAVSLLQGYPLYSGFNQGAKLCVMYPPLFALMYLPIAWIGDPVALIRTGAALATLYSILPVLWI